MTPSGMLQVAIYFTVLIAAAVPLGRYMARVYSGEAVFLSRLAGPLERGIYRCCRIDAEQEMGWKTYAGGLLIFSLTGCLAVYLMQRLQGFLPFNPQGFPAVSPDLAFNTAVSFVTNTNWQAYGGETTMSFFTQMAGLAVQNFVSAASGMAVLAAFIKLNPLHLIKNPVMFVVEIGCILTMLLFFQALLGHGEERTSFILAISLWLWFTLLFANFAEAVAEGRGKAQARSLKGAQRDVMARLLKEPDRNATAGLAPGSQLKKGDLVLVEAGETIPGDGEVTVGIASVDESAITGESAPVIRESGGDRSAVTGGTRVLSDWLIVRITANPGETFLDKMIAMVEGAKRQKTPNEIALDILLAGLTLIFLLATVTLVPFSIYSVRATGQGSPVTMTVIVALLICLIPTTIGGLLSAIGIAGMDRMIQANVIAMSGKAVEAAGDVDVLLLDKTGTITLGNREATEFLPVTGTTAQQFVERPSSHPWPTKRRREGASSFWQRRNTASASAISRP